MARIVSFVVLAAISILLGILFFRVMARFLLPIFLALILLVMFRPLHSWFVVRCRGRDRLAAGLTTLAILLIVLAPLSVLLVKAASDGVAMASALNRDELLLRLTDIRSQLGLALPAPAVRAEWRLLEDTLGKLRASLTPLTVSPPGGLLGAVMPAPVVPNEAEPDVDLQPLAEAARGQIEVLRRELDLHPAAALPTPSPPADNVPPLQSALSQLRTAIDGVVTAHQDYSDSPARVSDLSAEESSAPNPAEQLRTALGTLDLAQDQAQRRVFGEPWLYWLRVQFNPDADQARLEAFRKAVQEWVGPFALSTTQKLGSVVTKVAVGITILIISLFYFLADGPRMANTVMRLLPLDERYERQMLAEFDRVSRAVVVATLLSAIVQGFLAGIGYYVAGIKAVFLLGFLTMLLSMIPFVGAAAVWGSCSFWLLLYEGRLLAAVLLALYGLLVVSMADNVIKPYVLHGQSNIHPLLALLSVLGGVTALGPIGIFVGPMVVAFFHALLYMLRAEIAALSAPATPPVEQSLD